MSTPPGFSKPGSCVHDGFDVTGVERQHAAQIRHDDVGLAGRLNLGGAPVDEVDSIIEPVGARDLSRDLDYVVAFDRDHVLGAQTACGHRQDAGSRSDV